MTRLNELLRSRLARLVLLVFLVQTALVGAALLYVDAATTRELERQERAVILELRDDLHAVWQSGGLPELRRLVATRLARSGDEDLVLLVADAAGNADAGNLPGWPAGITVDRWQPLGLVRRDGSVAATTVLGLRLDARHRLLVGRARTWEPALAAITARAGVTALALAVPLALLLSVLLGRLTERRLRALAHTFEAVGGGELSRRATRDGSHDAFDALAGTMNAMLDTIESLVGELRIVTDSLAHDLRSPLTRLKSSLERARTDTADPAALAALDSVAGEADQLMSMLATALQISRAEAGIGRERFAPTDLDALLGDAVEIYGPVAEEQGIRLDGGGGGVGTALVHRMLVQQALGNLIENAMKHAEGARTVTVSATRAGADIALTVADDGIGIPADRHEQARRRFGRLDASRHVSGSGLGLTLAEAVARLHNGRLELADNRPGLVVTMRLHDPGGGRRG